MRKPEELCLASNRANALTVRRPWTQSCSHHQRESRPRTLTPMCIDETVTAGWAERDEGA
ncbi:MAG: hypothetical protein RLZZ179_2946 [Verrucomicrobiota bacterium]|jgi:hypothetical protein